MKKTYNHPTIESVEICLATGICSIGIGGGGANNHPEPQPGISL